MECWTAIWYEGRWRMGSKVLCRNCKETPIQLLIGITVPTAEEQGISEMLDSTCSRMRDV